MFYMAVYLCSEIVSQMSYLFVYYSVTGTYHAARYVYSRNKAIEPAPIEFCPFEERCLLPAENDYEVLITEDTAIYDIQKILKSQK